MSSVFCWDAWKVLYRTFHSTAIGKGSRQCSLLGGSEGPLSEVSLWKGVQCFLLGRLESPLSDFSQYCYRKGVQTVFFVGRLRRSFIGGFTVERGPECFLWKVLYRTFHCTAIGKGSSTVFFVGRLRRWEVSPWKGSSIIVFSVGRVRRSFIGSFTVERGPVQCSLLVGSEGPYRSTAVSKRQVCCVLFIRTSHVVL